MNWTILGQFVDTNKFEFVKSPGIRFMFSFFFDFWFLSAACLFNFAVKES